MKIGANVAMMLNVFRNQNNVSPTTLLCELIDNGIDAGASFIQIKIERNKRIGRTIYVADNGSGCLEADRFLDVGSRADHATTQLGRYGYGFTAAAVSLGNSVSVGSAKDGKKLFFRADWGADDIKSSALTIEPVVKKSKEPRGTRVVIHGVRRPIPGFESLCEEIGFRYAYGIFSKKIQILIVDGDQEAFVCPTQPAVEERIRVDFSAAGLRATLIATVVPSGHKNPRPGCHVICGSRTVHSITRLGKHTTENFFGWVVAHDAKSWPLSANKDQILDNKTGELVKRHIEDAILGCCVHLLKEASSQSLQFQFDEIASAANNLLKTEKEKRAPKTNRGETKTHNKRGSPRENANNTQHSGARINSAGLSVAWGELGIRFADVNPEQATVTINRDTRWAEMVRGMKSADAALCLSTAAKLLYIGQKPELMADSALLYKEMEKWSPVSSRG